MRTALFSVLAGLAACGCAPFATYPPDEGSLTESRSDLEPVPTVMAKAINHAHQENGGSGDNFAYNLPPGTRPDVYALVEERLGGAGHPQASVDELAYHVSKVRIRGRWAMVDVFYPKADGSYQFATVTLLGDVWVGYHVENTRLWETGDEPPSPSYAPKQPGDHEQIQRVLATDSAQP